MVFSVKKINISVAFANEVFMTEGQGLTEILLWFLIQYFRKERYFSGGNHGTETE